MRRDGNQRRESSSAFDWYLAKAGWDVTEQYLAAVEATCRRLEEHPPAIPTG